jgi:hypothetical protein
MDRADIPIEVALSIVLAAAVDGADRRGLLAALRGPLPVAGLPRPRPDVDGEGVDVDRTPALVFAFPTVADHDDEPDGPAAA